MINYLKLIRIQNLIIVVLTQYFMRYFIIKPILGNYPVENIHLGQIKLFNFALQFPDSSFLLLVLATVCLTAGGYVINDYFDRRTDMVNRPETVVVGRNIKRRTAMALHTVLNIVGILLGIYVSWTVNLLKFSMIYFIISGVLWFYSTTYKRQFLIGNIIVAALTALVPLLVAIYELAAINIAYSNDIFRDNISFNIIWAWVGGFSFFAFITTLIREIVKDIEDLEGDNAYGRNTLPIVLGIFTTKIILFGLSLICLFALAYAYFQFLNDTLSFWYFIVFLVIPFVYFLIRVAKAKQKDDYRFCSLFIKIIMLFGLLYPILAWYNFNYL